MKIEKRMLSLVTISTVLTACGNGRSESAHSTALSIPAGSLLVASGCTANEESGLTLYVNKASARIIGVSEDQIILNSEYTAVKKDAGTYNGKPLIQISVSADSRHKVTVPNQFGFSVWVQWPAAGAVTEFKGCDISEPNWNSLWAYRRP